MQVIEAEQRMREHPERFPEDSASSGAGPAAIRRLELRPAAGGAARTLVRPDYVPTAVSMAVPLSSLPCREFSACHPTIMQRRYGVCASMPRARPLSDRTILASP